MAAQPVHDGPDMLESLLGNYVPDLGGALWLGLLVIYLVIGDFRRLSGARNLAILGLLATAPFLNDIGRWSYEAHPRIAPWWWTAIFLITAGHTIWGFALANRDRAPWTPNLPRGALLTLAGLLLVMNLGIVLGRRAEDAGYYIALGAQRWVETGTIPYSDPQLVGPTTPGFGAASTYGPVLYLAHVPLQLALSGRPNPDTAEVKSPSYLRPPGLGTQLVTFAFHLLGLWGLFAVVRSVAGLDAALGAVIVYMAMPYLAGFDAGHGSIAGLRFISHIAPSALMLAALATASRPFVSGLLFAGSVGALFYPIFMFPAWLAWRFWRRDRPVRFALGVAAGGIAILALVIAFSPGSPGEGVRAFLHAVVEHQEGEGPKQYGTSTFGFWGTHPWLASFWHTPLVGTSHFTNPAFLGFVLIAGMACWWARGRGIAALAGITAALGAGIQLWKTHGGGTYIEWYLPFLILALVGGNAALRASPNQPEPEPGRG